MDRLEEAVRRAEMAQALKTNPLYAQAFDEVRAALLQTWAALPTSDTDAARDIHRSLKCLDRVRRVIDTHIDTGKLAVKEIEARGRGPLSLLRRA